MSNKAIAEEVSISIANLVRAEIQGLCNSITDEELNCSPEDLYEVLEYAIARGDLTAAQKWLLVLRYKEGHYEP